MTHDVHSDIVRSIILKRRGLHDAAIWDIIIICCTYDVYLHVY